ncbi:pathogenesis-related protein 1-like [Ziziphus jujuba]|uniref:Pathogenesis-related protein 1-like n=1 Tax=Ziziphus jujuba TaxID=326968 RepID=A0ABM3ZRU0_ZIZJJ|nr:pathogenesis-related protein 1-like [Ziziphus jujuba]
MGIPKVLVAMIISIISFSLLQTSHAQNSPQDYLNAHNSARTAFGVGPLVWDDRIAAFAQDYANKHQGDCNMVHSGGPYGENLAKSTGDLSGTEAVNLWVEEKPNYNYNSNSCVGGQCLHYTQVVWEDSARVGCGKVRCNNGGTLIGCNYDPRGNICISFVLSIVPQEFGIASHC